jgi:hypothetical protein
MEVAAAAGESTSSSEQWWLSTASSSLRVIRVHSWSSRIVLSTNEVSNCQEKIIILRLVVEQVEQHQQMIVTLELGIEQAKTWIEYLKKTNVS